MNSAAPATDLTHDEFVTAVEGCTLPNASFRHRDHLRLAWIYLRRLPFPEATERMRRTVRRFAAHHGSSGKYHETLTLVWMRLLASTVDPRTPDGAFEELLARNPEIADTGLPLRFYSRERLFGPDASERFVEPDLMPLPPVPA
jgi:hypothetical protein